MAERALGARAEAGTRIHERERERERERGSASERERERGRAREEARERERGESTASPSLCLVRPFGSASACARCIARDPPPERQSAVCPRQTMLRSKNSIAASSERAPAHAGPPSDASASSDDACRDEAGLAASWLADSASHRSAATCSWTNSSILCFVPTRHSVCSDGRSICRWLRTIIVRSSCTSSSAFCASRASRSCRAAVVTPDAA